MKFSIIIVTYKAHGPLLKCLESLIKNPPAPKRTHKADAEIILIDNSPEFIERHISNDLMVKLCQTYAQVTTEHHPENLGFAAACNLGAAKAAGENLVFVNPDTEVFPEWSERMASYLKPGVGAVGPISNFVAGFQQMRYHMLMTDTWERAARYAIKGCHHRGVETKMLIGFFLMVTREAWDKVGGMDPQFFLGCDDLDISMRLREAGYSLVIASDVFVYHEGHASFGESPAALVLNKQSEKRMLAKLQAKYGDNIPTSTELWGCEILATHVPKRQTLSVCMIVKANESEGALLAVNDMGNAGADEAIVVVTDGQPKDWHPFIEARGETSAFTYHGPGTVEPPYKTNPAKKLYFYPWTDSFADARNFALSKCTCDWVLWLDADDRVTPENAALIRAALDHPGPRTQAKTVHFGFTLRDHGPDGLNFAQGQPRLFPRVEGLKWEGRVHESYMDSAARLGIEKVDVDITIDHTGYKDPALMLKKHARNLRLMRMEEDSPKKFYHMGKNLQALGHYIEAEDCYRNCLEIGWAAPLETVFRDQVRTCMASLIITTKGADESVDEYLTDNGKPDALMLRAEVAMKRGLFKEARDLYAEYLALGDYTDPHGSSQELFQRVAKERLATIEKVVEDVYAR